MNKKLMVILGVVVIIGISYFLIESKNSKKQTVPPMVESSTPDCIGICVPFDSKGWFGDVESIGKERNYTDSITKNTVKIKLLTDKMHQARNSTFEIYVNNKLAGEIGGQEVSQISFSPDHRYFAIRTRSTLGCAGTCQNHSMYVVDLAKPLSMYLLVHPGAEANEKFFQDFATFIESYSWGTDNTILLTTYPVGMGKSGKLYRVTSKEVWSFDLTNPQSTMANAVLVNTIPE